MQHKCRCEGLTDKNFKKFLFFVKFKISWKYAHFSYKKIFKNTTFHTSKVAMKLRKIQVKTGKIPIVQKIFEKKQAKILDV